MAGAIVPDIQGQNVCYSEKWDSCFFFDSTIGFLSDSTHAYA